MSIGSWPLSFCQLIVLHSIFSFLQQWHPPVFRGSSASRPFRSSPFLPLSLSAPLSNEIEIVYPLPRWCNPRWKPRWSSAWPLGIPAGCSRSGLTAISTKVRSRLQRSFSVIIHSSLDSKCNHHWLFRCLPFRLPYWQHWVDFYPSYTERCNFTSN